MRQDADDVLGQDPVFQKHNAAFTKQPHFQGTRSPDGHGGYVQKPMVLYPYYPITDDVFKTLDNELAVYVKGMLMQNARSWKTHPTMADWKGVEFKPTQCTHVQPYLVWLLTVAKEVNLSFQQKVQRVVGERAYSSDPAKMTIKKLQR